MPEQTPILPHFPLIPDRHYFTIGDVSEWCGVEQHVLRYWEQAFRQLRPIRRGGRRFYTKKDLQIVKQIYTLLKDEGYTIDGAKRKLQEEEGLVDTRHDDRLVGEIINELQVILKSME